MQLELDFLEGRELCPICGWYELEGTVCALCGGRV
jgi:ribosomal protein L32